MRLEERFELTAPPERVWEVLNDIELIAPYIPGFSLEAADDNVFRGKMKVRVGAMTVEYDTEITIAERDDSTRTMRMDVAGREPRGGGKMQAAVTSRLEPWGAGTAVVLDTELELAGKIAQMGRGMIADVSSKLISDFVRALEADVLGRSGSGAPSASGHPAPSPSSADGAPVDITGAASRAAAKRLVPVVLAVVVLLWMLRGFAAARRS